MISINDYKDTSKNPHLAKMYKGQDQLAKSTEAETMLKSVNDAFNNKLFDEEKSEKAIGALDNILKSQGIKYYKRTGVPGNYKYFYTKEEYDKRASPMQ